MHSTAETHFFSALSSRYVTVENQSSDSLAEQFASTLVQSQKWQYWVAEKHIETKQSIEAQIIGIRELCIHEQLHPVCKRGP